MSETCGKHGWRHGQSPCPVCANEKAGTYEIAAFRQMRDEAQCEAQAQREARIVEVVDLLSERDALKAEIQRLHEKYDHQLLVKREDALRAQISQLRADQADSILFKHNLHGENVRLVAENEKLAKALERYRHCRHACQNCFCTLEARQALDAGGVK